MYQHFIIILAIYLIKDAKEEPRKMYSSKKVCNFLKPLGVRNHQGNKQTIKPSLVNQTTSKADYTTSC